MVGSIFWFAKVPEELRAVVREWSGTRELPLVHREEIDGLQKELADAQKTV